MTGMPSTDPDLTLRIEAERAKRQRRNLALRTPKERILLADQLQQQAYAVLHANPEAWEAFTRRNYRKRRCLPEHSIGYRDPGFKKSGS